MYHSNFYKIEVDKSQNLLQAQWLRAVSAEEIIEGGTKLYEVLRDTGVEKAIADARLFTTLSSDAKEWLSTKFYALLSQTNLKMLARVIPSALFHKIALESVVTRAEALGVTKFNVKNFTDTESALEWLQE